MLEAVVFAVVVIAQLVERVLAQRGWDAKERTLLNRIVADTPAELIALEREPTPRTPRVRDTEDEPVSVLPFGI